MIERSDAALSRLRASREQAEAANFQAGHRAGERWAMETAKWSELEEIANFEDDLFYFSELRDVLMQHGRSAEDVRRIFRSEGDWRRVSEAEATGFGEGARSVWRAALEAA